MSIAATTTSRPYHAPSDVSADTKRAVQAVGGAAKGLSIVGPPAVARAVTSPPFKFGTVPGAAAVSAAFVAYDTVQKFRRSGLGAETARTAVGGGAGVYAAFKGGAIGATIGAFGGPVGVVVGGAVGAVVGGIVGSAVGQGAVDAFVAARAVVRAAEVDSVGGALAVGAEALGAGAVAFGTTVATGVADTAVDLAHGAARVASTVGDAFGDAAAAIADVFGW